MAQHYSDPSRESDSHALPDVEVFYDDDDTGPWGERICRACNLIAVTAYKARKRNAS